MQPYRHGRRDNEVAVQVHAGRCWVHLTPPPSPTSAINCTQDMYQISRKVSTYDGVHTIFLDLWISSRTQHHTYKRFFCEAIHVVRWRPGVCSDGVLIQPLLAFMHRQLSRRK